MNNHCKECGSYKIRKDPDLRLCDKCFNKYELERRMDELERRLAKAEVRLANLQRKCIPIKYKRGALSDYINKDIVHRSNLKKYHAKENDNG